MKKRMLSLLLAVAMVVTLLPVTAFAADPMSDPLQEAWTKIAGRISGDHDHSVYAPYAIAVNDESVGDNPNIYVTTNDILYRVMKGAYDTGSKKYSFNELGGTGKPNFNANNMPVSLSLDGSFVSDGDLYIATNKGNHGSDSGKVWKFDGSSWTDLTYGQGITNPSIAASQGTLYVGGGGSAPYLCVLLKGSTKWEKLLLGSYIKSSLVGDCSVSPTVILVMFCAGQQWEKSWRIIVFPNGSATELVSCTQIAAAPSGGGSGQQCRSGDSNAYLRRRDTARHTNGDAESRGGHVQQSWRDRIRRL